MSLDDKIIRGIPHGSMSVLWNKSLSNPIRTIQFDDNRILGIEVKSMDTILLFLSLYFPYECDIFYNDYCFYLRKLQCLFILLKLPLPVDASLMCKNPRCIGLYDDINCFYDSIISILNAVC